MENIRVMPCAVAEVSGTLSFLEGDDATEGHLTAKGSTSVEVVTLDEMTSNLAVPFPDLIKIDVEGAEDRVLVGADRTIRQANPIIFLATHGQQVHIRPRDLPGRHVAGAQHSRPHQLAG